MSTPAEVKTLATEIGNRVVEDLVGGAEVAEPAWIEVEPVTRKLVAQIVATALPLVVNLDSF